MRFLSVILCLCLMAAAPLQRAVADKVQDVGGPYLLLNHFGEPVTDSAFQGKYQLIYFGYTYCPDLCPTGLQNMTDALEYLGPHANIVQPIFITIDPERDDVATMHRYVSFFDQRLVGLTGKPEMIANVARRFHVHYRKVTRPGDRPDEYLMDHTAAQYLMDPFGRFVLAFDHGMSPEDQAAAILKAMGVH